MIAPSAFAPLRAAFMNAPACICVLRGPDHVFEVANPPYQALVGGRALEGRPVREAVPELGDAYFALLDRVYTTGEPFHGREMPATMTQADGARVEVFFDFVYQPLVEDGAVVGIAAFGVDVTATVRARRQVEAERTKLRRLVEGAPFAVVVYEGPDHVVRVQNEVHDRLTAGRLRVGAPLSECLPELVGSETMRILDEVYATGETRSLREVHIPLHVDGVPEDRWFDVTWQRFEDGAGGSPYVMATAVQVTAHVLARRSLEAAHRRIEAITTNATLGLLLMDARGHCTFMNPAAEAITGFTLAEVRGRPLHEFVHHTRPDGSHYPIEECPIDRALPTRMQERGEDVFVHASGRFYPVAFTASPLHEPVEQGGRAVGTVIEVRDTTLEKRAEQERARILADLRAAVSARDEFLSVAAHELKTPITSLNLQLEPVQRALSRGGAVDAEKLAQRMAVSARQVDRLAALVASLLDVTRIDKDDVRLDLTDVDVVEVVQEVVERFAEPAARARATLQVVAPPSARARVDRGRLDQVVTNLLANAVKYGAGRPVRVGVTTAGVDVVIEVADEGIGVSAGDRARIFGRFERAVSPENYGGLGLGLYIARRIVVAHGGTIDVTSEHGRGATFTVRLPVRGP